MGWAEVEGPGPGPSPGPALPDVKEDGRGEGEGGFCSQTARPPGRLEKGVPAPSSRSGVFPAAAGQAEGWAGDFPPLPAW